jgi:hypothetical protein
MARAWLAVALILACVAQGTARRNLLAVTESIKAMLPHSAEPLLQGGAAAAQAPHIVLYYLSFLTRATVLASLCRACARAMRAAVHSHVRAPRAACALQRVR